MIMATANFKLAARSLPIGVVRRDGRALLQRQQLDRHPDLGPARAHLPPDGNSIPDDGADGVGRAFPHESFRVATDV